MAFSLAKSKALSSNRSAGLEPSRPMRCPSAKLKPRATILGGPSNNVHLASLRLTGIKGPVCEPLIKPATRCGKPKGTRTSPVAGSPCWHLTIIHGSSFPTYLPAIKLKRLVLEAAAGNLSIDLYTFSITYLPVVPIKPIRSYISSGHFRSTHLSSCTSITRNVNPSCIEGSKMRPAQDIGSANILKRGKLKAPGSVLSAAKTIIDSACLSSISISADPGPIPFIFPEKVLAKRS